MSSKPKPAPLPSGTVVGGYLGLTLLGSAFLGLGIMCSSWTRSQIVAYILGAVFSALFFFSERIVGAFWEGARDVVAYISFDAHYSNFTRGVIDTRDAAFLVAMTALFLVVSTFSLTQRRWK